MLQNASLLTGIKKQQAEALLTVVHCDRYKIPASCWLHTKQIQRRRKRMRHRVWDIGRHLYIPCSFVHELFVD
jgi:hypothetical protein